MLKALGMALALMMAGAVAMTPTAQAASFTMPELTADNAVELIAKKKCKKGEVYSKKKKKCVGKKAKKKAKAKAKAKAEPKPKAEPKKK